MGQRSPDHTVGALIRALMEKNRWEQAALARAVGVNTATVRRHMRNLQASDPSITCTNEPPHTVWRVPARWGPGSLPLGPERARVLFDLLSRTPGRHRAELMDRVASLLPQRGIAERAARVVVVTGLSDAEERAYSIGVDACVQRRALRMRYRSLSAGGEAEWRDVSPQRILGGAVFYLLAWCHRDLRLKRFRLSSIEDAKISTAATFHEVDAAVIDEHIATSANSFRGDRVEAVVFDVRRSAWARVRRNLPARIDDAAIEVLAGGEWVRLRVATAAMMQWAKHVVGLGLEARVPQGPLREAVRLVIDDASRALETRDESSGSEPMFSRS